MDEEELDKEITKIYDDFFANVLDFDLAADRLVDLGIERDEAISVLASMTTINFQIINDLETGTS